jgi:hypothetical protein
MQLRSPISFLGMILAGFGCPFDARNRPEFGLLLQIVGKTDRVLFILWMRFCG